MKKLIITLTLLICLASSGWAANGVLCSYSVSQKSETGYHLLLSDTIKIVENVPTSGFVANFSMEIQFRQIDSTEVSFDVHAITLGSQPNNYSQRYIMEYGLPAILNGIEGKNGTSYRLIIVPLEKIDVDESICGYDHRDPATFKFTPTAHSDIHYIPGSYGDYYWTVVKGIIEERYRRLKELFKFNLPGKYQVYLPPCPLSGVIWDKRFGISVDPTRSTGYAMFNQGINTFDPFVVEYNAVLRNFGYAPPFIAEGLSSFLSFAIFDMKQIVSESKNIPIAKLLDTYTYLNTNPEISDRTAASFVRYLVRQYKVQPMLDVYKKADDLNLQEVLETIYSKPIEELEVEWLNYVDTITIDPRRISMEMDLAEALFDYPRMLRYAKALPPMATGPMDSLASFVKLKQACFASGDYYSALKAQHHLLNIQNSNEDWLGMGMYNMMVGSYEEANSYLMTAQSLDSSFVLTTFNLGLLNMILGENDMAREMFAKIIHDPAASSGQGESRIFLGSLLLATGVEKDKKRAETYFAEANNIFQRALQSGAPAPTHHMWLGIAFMGGGDLENAKNHLQAARFLETRPYYVGMSALWLGKLSDLLGNHETALDFYGEVLSFPSAAYHQDEARSYLDSPFVWHKK